MVRAFCTSGENEVVKGAVHAAGGLLAAVMAAYNIAAWCYRRERHLGINAVVYSLAVLWELKQTAHHVERWDASRVLYVEPVVLVVPAVLEPAGTKAA